MSCNRPSQANIAPTAVAVLGAPTAEILLGEGGTGRRLQQESLAARLLAPIAESLPGTGRRLQQGGEGAMTAVGGAGAPLGENLAESAAIVPGTGRRLQQVGVRLTGLLGRAVWVLRAPGGQGVAELTRLQSLLSCAPGHGMEQRHPEMHLHRSCAALLAWPPSSLPPCLSVLPTCCCPLASRLPFLLPLNRLWSPP